MGSDEARLALHRRHLGQLYPVLAHDLHSFLNAMVLNLELLQRAAAQEPSGPETADRIRRYAARVAEEVPPLDRMLKAVVGQMRLSDPPTTRFDLLAVCEELGIVFDSYARYRRLRLRTTLAEVPVPVAGDRDAVQHALTALFLETLEALPAGSELAIDLQADRTHATVTLVAEPPAAAAGEVRELESAVAAREILIHNGAGIRDISRPDSAASLEISFRLAPEST
jgi:signal transduction histidine kinase